MGLLDFDENYKPPFRAPKGSEPVRDNLAELNNLGREEVSEDFEDMRNRIIP